jgi:membrane-associated protease RseP (regulator of RpoE activity)
MMITVLILLAALGVLGWGFYRARPLGKLGMLAWLQSVILIVPWLLFFSLFAAGVYLNLAGMLILFVISIGLYIFLGNRLRAAGTDPAVLRRASIFSNPTSTATSDAPEPTNRETDPTEAQSDVSPLAVNSKSIAIPASDLKLIQEIFELDTFFATETIPYQDGVIVKGNLRGEVQESYTRLSTLLADRLSDRYRLFLFNGPDDRPTVVVLPSSNAPQMTNLAAWGLALVLMLATVMTCMETASLMLDFDLFNQWHRFSEALPLAVGIILVLVAHELGHRLLAYRHQVKLGPPFFIPAWQVGSFGAVTRFESFLPNRNVLFDVALAGPALGGIVSLIMLIVGLFLSHAHSLFSIQSTFFQSSILVGTVARVILGEALQEAYVQIHPLAIIGWLGLVLTAINLMPAGQLDGGRVIQAIYGRKVAGRATVITLIVLGLAALVNSLALYWAIVILFLQRDLERPALNELVEPDDTRAALGLLALFLMAATLLPLAPDLAGRFGIGG